MIRNNLVAVALGLVVLSLGLPSLARARPQLSCERMLTRPGVESVYGQGGATVSRFTSAKAGCHWAFNSPLIYALGRRRGGTSPSASLANLEILAVFRRSAASHLDPSRSLRLGRNKSTGC